MPGPANIPTGSAQNVFVLSVPVSTTSLATGPSTQERTFTVPGLLVGDVVSVCKPSYQNTIAIGNVRVSANNTLAITFIATAGTPTPTTENYLVSVVRSSYPNLASIPAAIS